MSLCITTIDGEKYELKTVNMMKYWVNKQTRCYYRVHLDRDLLGDLTVTRSRGSLDSRLGRIQIELIPDLIQGRKILD